MELTGSWWIHTLLGGGLAVLATATTLVAVLFAAPYAFLSDHPADIVAAAARPTRRDRRRALIGGASFLLVFLASIGGVAVAWAWANPDATFLELFVMTFVIVVAFSLIDLVVVDWLIICTWLPSGIVVPGTHHCAGWRDKSFHLREHGQPKALAVPFVVALLLSGGAWLLTAG